MACDGPSIEFAYKQGEEFKDEVMQLLKDKHKIHKEGIMFDLYKWEWQEQEEKLKKAL